MLSQTFACQRAFQGSKVFYSLLLWILMLLTGPIADGAEFVGSSTCAACHTSEFEDWQSSDHAKSMAQANQNNVLGDFSDISVSFHGIDSILSTASDEDNTAYFVKTPDRSGTPTRFKIKYTFGHYPLQQYLIELEDGHVQALNIAWDARDAASGGQRWFHLRPEESITPEHPFYWTRHFQNWNSRCADCHSTNVQKNYNPNEHVYATTFSEINVACESCHGPASLHLELVRENKLTVEVTGFDSRLPDTVTWQFKNGQPIAKPGSVGTQHEVNMCGRCHALRTPLKAHSHGDDFLETNVLQRLSSPQYYVDGQIREEVFVMGSFLQSKMHQSGVTCTNCHNAHTGRERIAGNGLCGQCHAATTYDSPAHHRHAENSSGARCVNCHMPERTYMGVDPRRDHSFTIPDPRASEQLKVPNACVSCHSENDNTWASLAMQKWGLGNVTKKHWASTHQRAENLDVLSTPQLVNHAGNPALPVFVRASLLEDLSVQPSRASVEFAQTQLKSENSLLRKAAIAALAGLPAHIRWELLEPYLDDSSPIVRFQLAETLADILSTLPENQAFSLETLVEEYRRSLSLTLDAPATRLSLANLELRLGNPRAAEQEVLTALQIEPNYVPALVNLADLYRQTGRSSKAGSLLERAIAVAPDSGAANFSYGLHLVRQKQHKEALAYLKTATNTEDAVPRFSYTYAIALENDQQINQALDVLTAANSRWAHQYDLLVLQITYLDKLGRKTEILPYLGALSKIAPASPEIRAMIDKYATPD
jgi:tetratricopeptide (TPR) repeat protein